MVAETEAAEKAFVQIRALINPGAMGSSGDFCRNVLYQRRINPQTITGV
jgi:hypothetical protein